MTVYDGLASSQPFFLVPAVEISDAQDENPAVSGAEILI